VTVINAWIRLAISMHTPPQLDAAA